MVFCYDLKKEPRAENYDFFKHKTLILPPSDFLYFKKTYCNFTVSYKIRQIILYDKVAE